MQEELRESPGKPAFSQVLEKNSDAFLLPVLTGTGVDIHRLRNRQEPTTIILGGVPIPSTVEVEAHSDGDVLLHALCDAILSAWGLPDIGHYFPPSDIRWKDVPSAKMLEICLNAMPTGSYFLTQVHIQVVAQEPRISPYREEIRANLIRLLRPISAQELILSLHATTGEQVWLDTPPGIWVQCTVVFLHEFLLSFPAQIKGILDDLREARDLFREAHSVLQETLQMLSSGAPSRSRHSPTDLN